MAGLKVGSCLIDGEAVCCEVDGVPSFKCCVDGTTTAQCSSMRSTCSNSTGLTFVRCRLRPVGRARPPRASGPVRPVPFRSRRGRRSDGLPACLRPRRRGYCVEAQRLAVSLGEDAGLDHAKILPRRRSSARPKKTGAGNAELAVGLPGCTNGVSRHLRDVTRVESFA